MDRNAARLKSVKGGRDEPESPIVTSIRDINPTAWKRGIGVGDVCFKEPSISFDYHPDKEPFYITGPYDEILDMLKLAVARVEQCKREEARWYAE